MKLWRAVAAILLGASSMYGQDAKPVETEAGYVPVLSGAVGYVQDVNGGVTTLEPQIDPLLLVPFGRHVLLESRTDFTGFFQRKDLTSGPFKGKVFQTIEFAELDWLASTYVMGVAGRYLYPFGLYNERLDPIWIRKLQDPPITAAIGGGSGDGVMLRGVVSETPSYTIQYSSYFSALSTIHKLEASRTAGGDASIYLTNRRLEVGTSYQRLLENQQMNSVTTYVAWEPPHTPLSLMLEYDRNHNGQGYWLESALWFQETSVLPVLFRHLQFVGRMQQFYALNGGGNGLPTVDTNRFDVGLNYYFRDDLRLVSSYGRQFSSQGNANVWTFGFTYRFIFPLWPESKK